MFLLIQNPEVNSSYYFTYFTFHNVSINTENPDVSGVDFQNFTFHDVSINTLSSTHSKSRGVPLHSTMLLLIQIIRCMKLMLIASLHSTMFLLIRETWIRRNICPSAFTFHDVSINTTKLRQPRSKEPTFTFHDVSINTMISVTEKRFTFLYIPRCFY